MAGTQFYGKESVLRAYGARQISTWAIFQGKDLFCAGSDAEALEKFLEMLGETSKERYSLKVYNDIENPDSITSKTEHNGAFNFILLEPGTAPAVRVSGQLPAGPVGNSIAAVVNEALNEEMQNAFERRWYRDEPDEEKETIGSVILGYLREPEKLTPFIPIISAIGALLRPGAAAMPQMSAAAIGNAQPAGRVTGTEPAANDLQQQQARLVAVLDRLGKADPEILEHLEKLADIAEKEPGKYKMALSFL